MFSSCPFTDSYDSTYEYVFASAYLLGSPIQVSLETYARKYCTKIHGHKLNLCMPSGSTLNYTLIHTPTILNTKTFFVPACHPRKKISSKTKLSHSSLIHPRLLHTAWSTSKCDSKIDSIKSDHFPFGLNINKLIQHKTSQFKHKFESKHFPFLFFRVRVRVMSRVQSATRLQ